MKNDNGSIFNSAITSALISFLAFIGIYFMYISSPWATVVDAYLKVVLFLLVAVLLLGALVIGKKAYSVKSGIFSGLLASLGFFLLTFMFLALTFRWDYSYNTYLFFEGVGIDTSGISSSDVTAGFIIGYGLLISGIFAVITIIFNILAGILGGKKRD
ncbi:MAG: hypothetical protein JJE41_16430 [Candidatus Heimdallarchaeota archaeon]|nr:hypothetical protein [Candidatus Heimdallarchaeota archaeon]